MVVGQVHKVMADVAGYLVCFFCPSPYKMFYKEVHAINWKCFCMMNMSMLKKLFLARIIYVNMHVKTFIL